MYFILYFFPISLLFAVAIYTCYFYWITTQKVAQWKRSNTPFLPPTPLIGCHKLSNLRNKSPLHLFNQIYRENADKDLVAFFTAALPYVLLRDPKLIQKVFTKSWDEKVRTGLWPLATDVEAQSTLVLAPNKNLWKLGQSVMGPFMTTSRMGGPAFAKFKSQVDKLWHYAEETQLTGQPINAQEFAFNFVVDGVTAWCYSENTNSYEKKEELHEVLRYFYAHSYTRLAGIFLQIHFPVLQVFKSCKILPQKYVDFMRSFLEQKMNSRDETQTSHHDFIDHLMALRCDENANVHRDLSLRQMTGYSLGMLLTGTDTASHLCLFAVHLLSLHPQYQDRIKEEIDDVMKKHRLTEFTFEVFQDLHFTEQCIMETARLYPFNPVIVRLCLTDFQIPGTAYSLRKDETLLICPYALQRDPKYFKDPDKFCPERFSPQNKNSLPSDAFLTFGCGSRKCPGSKVGVLMAVIFAASLVFKYEIKAHSHPSQMTAADFDPKGAFILPKGQFLVNLIPR